MDDDVMMDLGIDDDVSDVWNELQETKDPADREHLLARLAECALRQHDFSDLRISEEVHEQFELLRLAQEEYHVTAVQVGRFVAHLKQATPIEEDPPPRPEVAN